MAFRGILSAPLETLAPPPGHMVLTVPPQPAPSRPPAGREVGKVVATLGFALVAGTVLLRLFERKAPAAGPAEEPGPSAAEVAAARRLGGGAAILAFSVASDSALEHYRGAFHNPAMYVAPTAASVALANSLHMTLTPAVAGAGRLALSTMTLTTGLIGLSFHIYNVAKREGGVSLLNLFYGAPLGAPNAIAISGLCGLAAARLVAEAGEGERPTLLGRPAGTIVGLGAAGAMLGTVAEAALLHFRGAFHDPFMLVPVTLPPVAAALLAAAAFLPPLRRPARWFLRLTAAAGIAGAGFHIYGVSRNMGGFRNWSQNLLNGPPIPAPPSFTGVALAGLAALRLMEAA